MAADASGKVAAGPWKEGRPDQPGRYLVEYEQRGIRKVFIADYEHHPNDPRRLEWRMHATEAKVLRYAKIHSDYA